MSSCDSAPIVVVDEDASNECDTLGLHWGDEPRRGGACASDVTTVAVSALTTRTIRKSPQLPNTNTTAGHNYLANNGGNEIYGESYFIGDSVDSIVADEDASNECDTLGLRWGDGPRQGWDGANDTTSVAVSRLTAPTTQTPQRLPKDDFQLNARTDKAPGRCDETKSKENTDSHEQANNKNDPQTSIMSKVTNNFLRDIDVIPEGIPNEDDAATLGLHYGDGPRRGGSGGDSGSVVSAITTPTIPSRLRSWQTATTGDTKSTDKTPPPPPPPVAAASDVKHPSRQISDTFQSIIHEEENSGDAVTPSLHHDDTLHCGGGGSDSESAREPIRLLSAPGAHHIFPSYATTSPRDAQQPLNTIHDPIVHITGAFLVEEEDEEANEEADREAVITGTPLETPQPPVEWWKQNTARLTLAFFAAALAVLSSALWFSLSLKGETLVVVQPTTTVNLQTPPPSMALSSPPSSYPSPSPPLSVAPAEALFENDCEFCNPQIAADGDTAVVVRSSNIHFFLATHSGFEITTKLDIDYIPAAVAINNNTAAIGSRGEGVVYVYERDQNGLWTQAMLIQPAGLCPGQRFGCDRGAQFGNSIAIDGNIMTVGAPAVGEVYVYRRNETTWTEEAKLVPPNDSNAHKFGFAVSLKGTSIVVGDPGPEMGRDTKGAVFVYGFDSLSNSWNPVSVTLMNSTCEQLSYKVRLMDNEDLLVVCGEQYSAFSTVHHYQRPGTGDEYVLEQSAQFGYLVQSFDVDQNTMVVLEADSGFLAIHYFVRKNNVWDRVAVIDEPVFEKGFGDKTVAFTGNITLLSSDRNVYQMATVIK